MLKSRRTVGPGRTTILTPIAVDEVTALNMESVAVLKATPDRFAKLSFSRGGDGFDDFDGAVLRSAALGPFGLLRYQGQPSGTISVVAPAGAPPVRINRVVDLVLRLGHLSEGAVEWSLRPRPAKGAASKRQAKAPRSVSAPRRAVG